MARLIVGTRAVLLNQTKSSPRIDDVRDFEEFLRSNQFGLYGRRGDAGAQPERGAQPA